MKMSDDSADGIQAGALIHIEDLTSSHPGPEEIITATFKEYSQYKTARWALRLNTLNRYNHTGALACYSKRVHTLTTTYHGGQLKLK